MAVLWHQRSLPQRLGALSHLCFEKCVVGGGEGPGGVGYKGDAVASVPQKACPVGVRLRDDCRAVADTLTQGVAGRRTSSSCHGARGPSFL